MNIIKAIVIACIGACLGFGLGSIPVLNENLHWNFFIIIPVSGLILGAMTAYLMYKLGKLVQLKFSVIVIVILTVGAVIGMYLVDYGIFRTGVDGLVIKDLMSFSQYLEVMRLEMGFSYYANLIGAGLGAFFTLFGMQDDELFCDDCNKHLIATQKAEEIVAEASEENLLTLREGFEGAVNDQSIEAVKAQFGVLQNQFRNGTVSKNVPQVQLLMAVHNCPTCSLKKGQLKYSALGDNGWEELDDLRLVVEER